jgi:hypothetical protein
MKMIYLGDGRLAGWTNSTGDTLFAYNNVGQQVGYYNKTAKQTYDGNGKPIQNGGLEALGFLILKNYKK